MAKSSKPEAYCFQGWWSAVRVAVLYGEITLSAAWLWTRLYLKKKSQHSLHQMAWETPGEIDVVLQWQTIVNNISFHPCFVRYWRMTEFILHWGKAFQALTCNLALTFQACTQLFIWLIQAPLYFSFYSHAQVEIGMLLVSVATQAAAFGSDPQDSLVFLHLCFKKSNIICAHLCIFTAYVCISLS